MNTDAVDHALRSIVHTCDDVVLARIIHFLKYVDDAIDIDGDPVAPRLDVFHDLINNVTVNEELADSLHILIDNIGAGTGDPEIRIEIAADERSETADLSAGAETEIISCCLILLDFSDIFGRKLYFCLVEIQCSVEITCKYFFLHHFFPFVIFYTRTANPCPLKLICI